MADLRRDDAGLGRKGWGSEADKTRGPGRGGEDDKAVTLIRVPGQGPSPTAPSVQPSAVPSAAAAPERQRLFAELSSLVRKHHGRDPLLTITSKRECRGEHSGAQAKQPRTESNRERDPGGLTTSLHSVLKSIHDKGGTKAPLLLPLPLEGMVCDREGGRESIRTAATAIQRFDPEFRFETFEPGTAVLRATGRDSDPEAVPPPGKVQGDKAGSRLDYGRHKAGPTAATAGRGPSGTVAAVTEGLVVTAHSSMARHTRGRLEEQEESSGSNAAAQFTEETTQPKTDADAAEEATGPVRGKGSKVPWLWKLKEEDGDGGEQAKDVPDSEWSSLAAPAPGVHLFPSKAGKGTLVLPDLNCQPIFSGLSFDPEALPPPPSCNALRSAVHTRIMSLARAYLQNDALSVHALSLELGELASPSGCLNQRLAGSMLRVLRTRFNPPSHSNFPGSLPFPPQRFTPPDVSEFHSLNGWAAFARVASTVTLSHALLGHSWVHVLVLPEKFAVCWATLFRRLAAQAGGAPRVRVTCVEFTRLPQSLALLCCSPERLCPMHGAAKAHGVPLVYQKIATTFKGFNPGTVHIDPREVVAVASCWHLAGFPDSRTVRFNPRNCFLKWIASISPVVFVLMEYDGNYNTGTFLERLQHFLVQRLPMFEACDKVIPRSAGSRFFLEFLVQKLLEDCVVNEGIARLFHDESIENWLDRMAYMGFQQVAFSEEAWTEWMLLSSSKSYRVERYGETAVMSWCGVANLFATVWILER